MAYPRIVHHFGAHTYIKETHIDAGTILPKHKHSFDHLSVLVSGSVLLTVDDESRAITGYTTLKIEAGKAHTVSALTDVIWLCIHATDETDPEKVDHVLIKEH